MAICPVCSSKKSIYLDLFLMGRKFVCKKCKSVLTVRPMDMGVTLVIILNGYEQYSGYSLKTPQLMDLATGFTLFSQHLLI